MAFSPRRHSGLRDLPLPHHRVGAGRAGGQVDASPSAGIGSNLVAMSYGSASSATVPGAVPGKSPGCLGSSRRPLQLLTCTAGRGVARAPIDGQRPEGRRPVAPSCLWHYDRVRGWPQQWRLAPCGTLGCWSCPYLSTGSVLAVLAGR